MVSLPPTVIIRVSVMSSEVVSFRVLVAEESLAERR